MIKMSIFCHLEKRCVVHLKTFLSSAIRLIALCLLRKIRNYK